jgi:hypothetical protein
MKSATCCALGLVLLCTAPGLVLGEDNSQRASSRSSARSAAPAPPRPAPLWATIPIGLGLGAAALPLSPVYAAIVLGATQVPQSRLFLSKVGSAVKRSLGMKPAGADAQGYTLQQAVRALNSLVFNLVDELDKVPAFVVVKPSGEPLQISFTVDPTSNFTFAYLELADATRLVDGLPKNPNVTEPQLKIVGCARAALCSRVLCSRASALGPRLSGRDSARDLPGWCGWCCAAGSLLRAVLRAPLTLPLHRARAPVACPVP